MVTTNPLLWSILGGFFCSAVPLESPSKGVPADWLTTAERSQFRQTPETEKVIAFYRRLAAASGQISYRTFGRSPEGRELPLVVVSKEGSSTPEEAKKSNKLVLLIQNCIHAGECAGNDATMMLLRDIAITKKREKLLDQVQLVIAPLLNIDGHARRGPHSRINQNGPEQTGWRVTSRNLNLNRDYMKADTVEMRAWLGIWNAWRPDFFIDNHTTDGGDWQYDITYAADTHEIAAPPVARWLRKFLRPLRDNLRADGHVPMAYFWLVDGKDPAKGIRSGGFGARYSTGYVALRNRPAFLVETHMLKPYRTRVISHYNFMLHVLTALNRNPRSLRKAIQKADRTPLNKALPIALERTKNSVPLVFKGFAYQQELSAISGDVRIIYDNKKPIDLETVWFNQTKVKKMARPPRAYLIPPQWTEVIARLKAHGLRFTRLAKPQTIKISSYRFEEVSFAEKPYEGRVRPKYKTVPITESRTFVAGTVRALVKGPSGKVLVHLLEPESADSFVAWGFFNAIFEQKEYGEHYVLEALARRMLAADPKLRRAFEQKIRTDKTFAKDPRARLYFFYQRSPFWDDRMNVYPVARVDR